MARVGLGFIGLQMGCTTKVLVPKGFGFEGVVSPLLTEESLVAIGPSLREYTAGAPVCSCSVKTWRSSGNGGKGLTRKPREDIMCCLRLQSSCQTWFTGWISFDRLPCMLMLAASFLFPALLTAYSPVNATSAADPAPLPARPAFLFK